VAARGGAPRGSIYIGARLDISIDIYIEPRRARRRLAACAVRAATPYTY
jgi:hypothetical protein